MIIVNLTGGLGNQMFQYAFGKALANKYRTDLKLHFTNALFNTQREFELNIFNISGEIATHNDLQKFGIVENRVINRLLYLFDERFGFQLNQHIVTQKFPYDFDSKYLKIKDNSYLQGYWGYENYFKSIEKILRNEFTFKHILDEKNKELLRKIVNSESVSIHVRRGDYVTNKMNIPKFIGKDYYLKAIKQIKKIISKPLFFIFSDDILWCKQNLANLVKNIIFIDGNKDKDSYKDLMLMSYCKHNIIANSTFSWWAGWLNNNKKKVIIRPEI